VHPLSLATVVSYRRAGQVRGSPHKAIIPGHVTEHDPAAILLEAVLGPVEHVTILETIRRPVPAEVIVDTGEPEPLVVPIVVAAPYHVIHIDEAWAFAGTEAQRWTLPGGKAVLAPKPLWRCQLALRSPGQPTTFVEPAA
jgi:hypothetical protein